MYSYINMEEDGRMKRIAVVSDIHANKYALNAFLEYINKEKINTILNLGISFKLDRIQLKQPKLF